MEPKLNPASVRITVTISASIPAAEALGRDEEYKNFRFSMPDYVGYLEHMGEDLKVEFKYEEVKDEEEKGT